MKVGMIFECVNDGPDEKVCKHLTHLLDPHVEIVPVTLTNKRNLISDCGMSTALLLKQGCDRVIIFGIYTQDGALRFAGRWIVMPSSTPLRRRVSRQPMCILFASNKN